MSALLNGILARSAVAHIAILVSLACLLSLSVFSAYWRWDDPSILLHIHRYAFWQDFLLPEVWQEFSPSNLTPWLSISFELDLILFGLNTAYYYAHHLLALAAAAVALYFTLGLWIRPLYAMLGGCLFLLGAPALVVAQQLMTRHYIEGAVFCLAALWFFVRYLRQGRFLFLIFSALAYLLAVTAKEIYVPLVVLLFFIPENEFRSRCKALLPHLAIASCYTLWRAYMLGSLGGGYTEAGNLLTLASPGAIADTFLRLPELLFGTLWPAAVLLYLALAGSYVYLTGSRMLVVVLTALLILLPMIPLVSFPGITIADRYLFLPWLGFCFSVAYFANQVHQSLTDSGSHSLSQGLYPVLTIIFFVSAVSAMNVRSSVVGFGREFDAHGVFIWEGNEELAFLPSAILLASYWYVTDLEQFKQRLIGESSTPIAIIDPALTDSSLADIWQFDNACACLIDTGDSLDALRRQRLANVDNRAPLTLNFAYELGYFDWQFGPYAQGQYHVVSEQLGLLPAPAAGRLRVNIAPGTEFRLRYTAPEGWVSYSEPQLIVADGERKFWERN